MSKRFTDRQNNNQQSRPKHSTDRQNNNQKSRPEHFKQTNQSLNQGFTNKVSSKRPKKGPSWLVPLFLVLSACILGIAYTSLTSKQAEQKKEVAQKEIIKEQEKQEKNYKEQFDAQSGLTDAQREMIAKYQRPDSNQLVTGGIQTGQKTFYNESDPQGVLDSMFDKYLVKDFNTSVKTKGVTLTVCYLPQTASVTNVNKTLTALEDTQLDATVNIIDISNEVNQAQYYDQLAAQGVYASVPSLEESYAIITFNGVVIDNIYKTDLEDKFTIENIQQVIEEVKASAS